MKYKVILLSLFASGFFTCYSQSRIEYIKQQEYLKLKNTVDCNNITDNLTGRICANLAFQGSDSLLTVAYDSLILAMKSSAIDSIEFKLKKLQRTWYDFRDEHCAIVYDSYGDCGGCHQQAIDYLNCLRDLTDDRIHQITKLKKDLLELNN